MEKVEILKKVDGDWVWTDISKFVAYPIDYTETLDETLDSGLFQADIIGEDWYGRITEEAAQPYKRFSKVRITLTDSNGNEKKLYYLANDKVDRIRTKTPCIYRHTFMLIEPTKLLQKIFISGQATTQPVSGIALSLRVELERLLSTNPTRYKRYVNGDFQAHKYKLDSSLLTILNAVTCPEFKWTCKMTLFECLVEVGKVIGGFPRLLPNSNDDRIFDTISFDFFGKLGNNINDIDNIDNLDKAAALIGNTAYSADCDESNYCTALETYAENMICEGNEAEASITYPSKNGWITPRCMDTRLTEKNASIMLPMPIYKIKSVLVYCSAAVEYGAQGEIYQYTNVDVDMTSRFVTLQVWQALSDDSLTSSIEDRKANTVFYNIGDNQLVLSGTYYSNRIDLFFSVPTATIILAIEKAVLEKFAKDFNYTIVDDDVATLQTKLRDLKFRIEYIPITSARLTTVKDLTRQDEDDEVLTAYNQSGELVSSDSLGRNMWAQCQAMGLDEFQSVAHFTRWSDMLSIGDYYESYILTKIEAKIKSPNTIEALFTFSDKFNRLSQRVAINKQYRQHAIPLNESVEKHLKIDEYCVLSTSSASSGNTSCLTETGIKAFGSVFPTEYEVDGDYEIDCADFEVISQSSQYPVVVSTVSRHYGNSLAFTFAMVDNYSAGRQIIGDEYECKDVKYTLDDGTLYNARIAFGNTITNADEKLLPLHSNGINKLISIARVNVQKDVGEKIACTYQLHVIPDNEDIVIGRELLRCNPLVGGPNTATSFKIWNLNQKVSRFCDVITTTYGTEIEDASIKVYYDSGVLKAVVDFKESGVYRYAVTNSAGKLYYAVQPRFTITGASKTIYFNFKNGRNGE